MGTWLVTWEAFSSSLKALEEPDICLNGASVVSNGRTSRVLAVCPIDERKEEGSVVRDRCSTCHHRDGGPAPPPSRCLVSLSSLPATALVSSPLFMLQLGSPKKMDEPFLSDRSKSDASASKSKWSKSDIYKLAICWALTLTTSTLLTTIGPLAAVEIGVSDSLAPFTIGIFLMGAAISSVPSGFFFRKYGRIGGFTIGCVCQVIGSILGIGAMYLNDQAALFIGCMFVGLGQGLGQFYRFAAVEISPVYFKSKAVTYVLTGGVIAAFLGPTSATYTVDILKEKYVASFMAMALIGVLNQIAVSLVNFPSTEELRTSLALSAPPSYEKPRPIMEILTSPLFMLSCSIATIAHTVMVMVMSNCALSMDTDYSFFKTSLVMQFHFFAMFAPGFYTGSLIAKHGAFKVSVIGAFIFAGSAFVFAAGKEEWNYFGGMILLGLAWNFSFSAGTVMLTQSYLAVEAVDVQAWNDFILFTVASAGSLASGYLYSYFGWYVLIYVASGMMGFNLLLFYVAWDMRKLKDSKSELPVKVDLSFDGSETASGYDSGYDLERKISTGKEQVAFPRVLSNASQHSEEEISNLANVRTISVA